MACSCYDPCVSAQERTTILFDLQTSKCTLGVPSIWRTHSSNPHHITFLKTRKTLEQIFNEVSHMEDPRSSILVATNAIANHLMVKRAQRGRMLEQACISCMTPGGPEGARSLSLLFTSFARSVESTPKNLVLLHISFRTRSFSCLFGRCATLIICHFSPCFPPELIIPYWVFSSHTFAFLLQCPLASRRVLKIA